MMEETLLRTQLPGLGSGHTTGEGEGHTKEGEGIGSGESLSLGPVSSGTVGSAYVR